MLNQSSADQNFAGFKPRAAKQNVHEFRSAGTYHSGDSENFPFSENERDVLRAVAAHTPRLEDDFPDWHAYPSIERRRIAADHVFNQGFFGQSVDVVYADFTSIPQDRYSVRDPENLFQVMGNVDDPEAAFFYCLNYIQQILDLGRGE